jgi:tetratricopeptide (TPR) repeat protein
MSKKHSKFLRPIITATLFCLVGCVAALAQRDGIRIIDTGNGMGSGMTNVDGGPDVGSILNAHYFPALEDYRKGNFRSAISQMDYFLARPQYTSGNPKQREYLSLGSYIRGMIYLYHAVGRGRHNMARLDFEKAISLNPDNHFAYLELANVYAFLELKQPAINTIEKLLALNPDESVSKLAKQKLEMLRSPQKNDQQKSGKP